MLLVQTEPIYNIYSDPSYLSLYVKTVGFFEHSYEPLGSLKGGKFLISQMAVSLSRKTLLHGLS
jgi:hypothetical protein